MDGSKVGEWDVDKTNMFLGTLYQVMLGRQPDENGLATHGGALVDGTMTGQDVVFEVMTSPEFVSRHGEIMPVVFSGIVKGLTGKEPNAKDFERFLNLEPSIEGIAALVRAVIDEAATNDDWYRRIVAKRGMVKIILDELATERADDSKLKGDSNV